MSMKMEIISGCAHNVFLYSWSCRDARFASRETMCGASISYAISEANIVITIGPAQKVSDFDLSRTVGGTLSL